METKAVIALAATAIVIGIPFILRPGEEGREHGDDQLILLSPHNEAIRSEFSTAFRDWYQDRTGRSIALDWRSVGGTSEIVQFMQAQFSAAFQTHWVRQLNRVWTGETETAFTDPSVAPDDTPGGQARRAFLDSDVGIGVDIFFGGGSYDHRMRAQQGFLVPTTVRRDNPEWFVSEVIPQSFAGEEFYDLEDRWFGAAVSGFGLIFNRQALKQLGIDRDLDSWSDLALPELFGKVAVADPSKSGSVNKAFEMMVQQVMQEHVRLNDNIASPEVLADGWNAALALLQRICANARYVTDSAGKPVLDVARGDCAAGMAIDFYGRIQEQNLRDRVGSERFVFVLPPGGSSLSSDPIATLRGAPNPEAARLFIEFVLSPEGQRLWNQHPGTPGGPIRHALRRSPVRRDAYAAETADLRTDADVNPFETVGNFHYQPQFTAHLFGVLRTIIKSAFIDNRPELQAAWQSILLARAEGRDDDADRAEAHFDNLTFLSYADANNTYRIALRSDPMTRIQTENAISESLRAHYREVRNLAGGTDASQ